ncbi:hypothetical protein [Enterococcus cecorum]|uniref:hypothetical protein n=1 Tax=Enterococcus cecorum TaxID=44008 RepID=UPI001FAC2B89|nr:hypothetical protein [Enterococcus cecorum]MCJ0573260.1 hypothetical protein [Enterococcus cecorum]
MKNKKVMHFGLLLNRELFLPNPTVEIKEFYWHCIKTTCNAFLIKVVRRVGQLQAAKFVRNGRKIHFV